MTNSPTAGRNLQISYSSSGTFDSCARKFEFRKIYPRPARTRTSLAAEVGKCLHEGFQTYLATQSEDDAYWALLNAYPYDLEAAEWDDKRSLESCVSTLESMIAYGNMDEWELLQIIKPNGEKVPAIEVPFELVLKGITLPDGRGISIIGYIDAAMRNLVTGLHRTMDIKTNRSNLKDASAKYQFDNQQTPYGIAISHVTGVPIDEFEVLYLDCFVDLVEPRTTLYSYHRDSTDIEEWLVNTVLRAERIKRALEMDYFPRTDNGCLSFNRPCEFLELCQTRDREAITEMLLLGQEPDSGDEFEPWIQAEIDVFGSNDGVAE